MKNPVLAVFGNALFVETADNAIKVELPDGADLTSAMLQLIARLETKPKQLDLVYHPNDLQVVAAECANVSRPKLKAFFAGEYRELTNPATLWGCTKPQPHLDGKYTTLLHYEQRPRLEHVLQLLDEAGVKARVVLPPAAALVNRTKKERLELAILVEGESFFFYHVNELGISSARFLRNVETLGEQISVALASRKNPPAHVLIVGDESAAAVVAGIHELLAPHELKEKTATETWAEYLRSVDFSAADFANLAQRPFKWRRQHSWLAAAALLTIASGFLAYDYVTKQMTAHRLALQVDRHRRELERDVATLERTEKRYHEAEALVAAIPLANPRPSALLDAVTQALPATLQLQSYRFQGGQFTIEGLAFEGIGQEKGPLAQFLDAVGGGSRPWTLKAPKAALASSNWNLNGTITP